MFIAIVIITIGFIAFLTFRDWIAFHRLTPQKKERLLVHIAKLLSMEEWQAATKLLTPLLGREECSSEERLLYIHVLRGTKEHEKALQCAIEGSKQDPEQLLFRIEEGKTLLEMGEASAALTALKIAEPIMRKESDLLDLATAYLHSGHPDEALAVITPFLGTIPRAHTLALAGEIFIEKREGKKAIFYLQQAIEKGGLTHQIHIALGHAHRLMGNFHEAERIYRKILEKDGSDIAATLGLGACMEERGFFQRALLIYQSCDAWNKKHPRILLAAARCALYTKRYLEAEEYYFQIIEGQKYTPDLLVHYGYVLERQQKWLQAEKVYRLLAQEFASDSRGHLALAWLFGVGLSPTLTHEEALSYAQNALTLSQDPLSWEILSAVEARMGRFEKAYQIQEYLSTLDQEKGAKTRRGNVMRALRRQLPLDEGHISLQLVA